MKSAARRVALETVGWVLVVAGIAALVLPGPGLLMVFAGLVLLSQQYDWAERRVEPVKKRALKAAAEGVETWPRIVMSTAVAAAHRGGRRGLDLAPSGARVVADRGEVVARRRVGDRHHAGRVRPDRDRHDRLQLPPVPGPRRGPGEAGPRLLTAPTWRRPAGSEADRQPGVVLGQPGGAGLARGDPAQLGELELLRRTGRRSVCSIVVIHQEKCVQRQTRRSAVVGVARRPAGGRPCAAGRPAPAPAGATSATARLSPLAPVGGTMWAASPARNSRPCRIGVGTKRAHRQHALLGDRARGQLPAVLAVAEPGRERLPDPVVGPVRRRRCRWAPAGRAG